jgi:ABC-type branched-subunit amino acid transport system substrate-binding protein
LGQSLLPLSGWHSEVHIVLRSFLAILVTLFLGHVFIAAQEVVRYSDEAEKIFLEGVQRFESKDFDGANEDFAKIIAQYSSSQRASAAYLMEAKSLFHLRRYDESAQLLTGFLEANPQSRYLADAHFTLGLDYYVARRYEPAAGEFLEVLDLTREQTLVSEARPLLETICSEHLDAVAINRLYGIAVSPEARFLLAFKLSDKYISAGKPEQVRDILGPLVSQYPNSVYAARARELLRLFGNEPRVKIGAVLPLFLESKEQSVKEIGAEMLQGIQYAIDEARTRSGVWIDLKYLDSEADSTKATGAVRTLSGDRDVVAIIGPAYSSEVNASARIADERGVPLVSPTANANGLASLGPYIFQANPDFDLRGRASARYAMQHLGLRTFAVLAPSDSYGKLMADSFLAEVARLGGTIIGTEWYQRGTTDLQEQFLAIRKAARIEEAEPVISFAGNVAPTEITKFLEAGVPRHLLDSLLSHQGEIGVNEILGSNGQHVADSLGIATVKDLLEPDSLDYPITTIDGFYLPIADPEDIGILSSQLVYYNFKTHILGTGDWYNPVELDANRRYLDGIIFDSDTYVDASDSSYTKFFDGFYESTNARPTKNTLFGYDTAELLISVISKGAVTREEIRSSLGQVRDFKGLHSLISFNLQRVNSALNALRYKGGEVKKLDDVIVRDE